VEDGWGRVKEHALWPDHCVIGTRGCELDRDLVSAFEPLTDKLKLARKVWRSMFHLVMAEHRAGTRL